MKKKKKLLASYMPTFSDVYLCLDPKKCVNVYRGGGKQTVGCGERKNCGTEITMSAVYRSTERRMRRGVKLISSGMWDVRSYLISFIVFARATGCKTQKQI